MELKKVGKTLQSKKQMKLAEEMVEMKELLQEMVEMVVQLQ